MSTVIELPVLRSEVSDLTGARKEQNNLSVPAMSAKPGNAGPAARPRKQNATSADEGLKGVAPRQAQQLGAPASTSPARQSAESVVTAPGSQIRTAAKQARSASQPREHRVEQRDARSAMPRPENPADPARSAPKEAGAAAVELLLRVESMAREALDLTELRQLIANETRKLNRARQVFVIEVTQRGGARLVGASGVANVDRNSALAGSIEALVAAIDREGGVSRILDFSLPAYCDPQSDLASAYPFREMMWLPLQERNGRAFGGLLMARESVWSKDDAAISRRLAATFAHAWRELATAHYFRPRIGARRRWALLSMLAVALLMVVPVPMTALAPVEIVARRPFIVAAPIDGVIDAIEVDPGATVTVGQPLARLSDTLLKSRVEVASREVALAEVRVKQATIMAFNDARGRHELGIAEADLELKKAEQFYASELLAKTVVRAERSGVAHYVDRKALEGRPVATGERIMEIAEPEDVEARLDLAVPDVVALSAESPVKLFLDVDPLAPWHGKVVRSDYRARPSDADVMSFRTFAQIEPGDRPPPRIGLRGTAQVVGRTTAFGVFLFRRPLTALRQWIGI